MRLFSSVSASSFSFSKKIFAFSTILCLGSVHLVHAASSDVDTSFAGGGALLTQIGPYNDRAVATAPQSDGKWLVVGDTATNGAFGDVAIVRYTASGQLDTSFGSSGNGRVIAKIPSYSNATSIAVQPDGKILIAGTAMDIDPVSKIWRNYVFVARYLSSGLPDSSFGGGGFVKSDLSGLGDVGSAMALQADGKILVVGSGAVGTLASAKRAFQAVRYLSNGAMDTSFGTGGKFLAQLSTISHSEANAVALQTDGKIVLAGNTYTGGGTDVAVVRLTANGLFDATFGQNGVVKTTYNSGNVNFTEHARAIAVQPDGKIVVAGSGSLSFTNGDGQVALFRYNSNGSLDSGFGNSQGYTIHDISTGLDEAQSISLAADGRILLAGTAYWPSNGNAVATLSRYDSNGRIDSTFSNGGNGFLTLPSMLVGSGVAIGGNGRIVVTGHSARDASFFATRAYVGDTLDLVPDAQVLNPLYSVPPSSTQISNPITVSGLSNNTFVPITVGSGSYSINGAPFVSRPGWIKNGDIIRVQQVTANTTGTKKNTVIRMGGTRTVNNAALTFGVTITVTFTTTTW